jgi:hypothetical protein
MIHENNLKQKISRDIVPLNKKLLLKNPVQQLSIAK